MVNEREQKLVTPALKLHLVVYLPVLLGADGIFSSLTVAKFVPLAKTKSTTVGSQTIPPSFITFHLTVKAVLPFMSVPSFGFCEMKLQEYPLKVPMGVGEATMKTKVGVAVGVSDGIRVGKGVTLGVRVGGMSAAV
jgi:hypothetical protein